MVCHRFNLPDLYQVAYSKFSQPGTLSWLRLDSSMARQYRGGVVDDTRPRALRRQLGIVILSSKCSSHRGVKF